MPKEIRDMTRHMRTFGTSAGGSITQTEYTNMVLESIPSRLTVMTYFFMWIVPASFLVPSSLFLDIQMISGVQTTWQCGACQEVGSAVKERDLDLHNCLIVP